MSRLLLGAVGMLVLQAFLVVGYLSVSKQDPIILNPDRGGLVASGVMMATFCGEGGSGKEMLPGLPSNGRWDSWTRGQRCGATATSGITTETGTPRAATLNTPSTVRAGTPSSDRGTRLTGTSVAGRLDALSPLSLAVGYNTVVTHGRRSCNNALWQPTWPVSCGTPALIMLLAALGRLFGAAFALRPLRVARNLER